MDCVLIADSGSTKTDWILVSKENGTKEIHSTGINPVRDSRGTILSILEDELKPQIPHTPNIREIHFYGAGCTPPFSKTVEECLLETFPQVEISVDSDLLGAARALCGHNQGIACILGTGSNSCLYDGEKIVSNVSPLGFILGDEGSGAVLGRTLVGDILKGMLGDSIREEFLQEYELTPSLIIDKVYRGTQPNRFLASLVPFIEKHRNMSGIHNLLISSFRSFLSRNIAQYGRPDLPLNFVGSIAHIYEEELQESIRLEGMIMGKILQKPIAEIANFHIKPRKK